jgi:hypothetical protein
MEIGLISILVGFMVGAGVRKGSRHRGGWHYQLLAVILTYSAIAASYSAATLPQIFAAMREKEAKLQPNPKEAKAGPDAKGAKPQPDAKGEEPPAVAEGEQEQPDAKGEEPPTVAKGEEPPTDEAKPGPGRPADVVKAAPAVNAGARADPGDEVPTALGLVIALALAAVFCYSLPILVGIQQPIGLLIVAFALWEAWKLNRRVPLVFNGPFEAVRGATSGDGHPHGEVASHA